jgi:hypothetical protein
MDEGERFMWLMALIIVVALLFTLSFTSSQYTHGDLEAECRPNIYPICFRASEPAAIPPASPVAVFVSIAATGVLALILLYAGYHASVTKQANLIVATADVKKDKADDKPAIITPVVQPKAAVQPQAVQITPQSTHAITKIPAPSAKPSKGVDPGLVS